MTDKRKSITVRRGQTYRVPRNGKPAAFIRILGVRRGDQPKVTYRRIARSGRRRPGEPVAVHWLQWRDGAWRLPPSWETVN